MKLGIARVIFECIRNINLMYTKLLYSNFLSPLPLPSPPPLTPTILLHTWVQPLLPALPKLLYKLPRKKQNQRCLIFFASNHLRRYINYPNLQKSIIYVHLCMIYEVSLRQLGRMRNESYIVKLQKLV